MKRLLIAMLLFAVAAVAQAREPKDARWMPSGAEGYDMESRMPVATCGDATPLFRDKRIPFRFHGSRTAGCDRLQIDAVTFVAPSIWTVESMTRKVGTVYTVTYTQRIPGMPVRVLTMDYDVGPLADVFRYSFADTLTVRQVPK